MPLFFKKPQSRKLAPVARFRLKSLSQHRLMREIVTDHPVVPGQFRPVDEIGKPRKKTGGNGRCVRRGIKNDPAVSREIGFDPTVRVTRTHNVIAAQFVELTRQEAVYFARRNTQRSEERRVGKECRSRWSPY